MCGRIVDGAAGLFVDLKILLGEKLGKRLAIGVDPLLALLAVVGVDLALFVAAVAVVTDIALRLGRGLDELLIGVVLKIGRGETIPVFASGRWKQTPTGQTRGRRGM